MLGIAGNNARYRALLFLAQRNSVKRVAVAGSSSPCQYRGFASDAEEETQVMSAEEVAKIVEEKSHVVTPWMAKDVIRGAEKASSDVDIMRGRDAYTSGVPTEHSTRKVRIYSPARNAMQSGTMKTMTWKLEFENQERWNNMLMGWSSSGDPLGATGASQIKFESAEDAARFCDRNGWEYHVESRPEKPDFEGDKAYASNFLNYHVENRMKKRTTKEVSESQFAHPERGSTCFVNLEHTNYGDVESKVVSGTHWDPAHPNNHGTKSWRYDDILKKQELSRKLGK